MFKNLDDEWETKGFFNIEPNEEVYVAKTENRIYYFSAITFDGKIKWEGGFKGTVHGNQESFKEKTIPSYKKHGEHYTYLNCNN